MIPIAIDVLTPKGWIECETWSPDLSPGSIFQSAKKWAELNCTEVVAWAPLPDHYKAIMPDKTVV